MINTNVNLYVLLLSVLEADMAKCKLSVEEQRRRNGEYQRKRRQRIDSDPDSRRDNIEKEGQRWKNRV